MNKLQKEWEKESKWLADVLDDMCILWWIGAFIHEFVDAKGYAVVLAFFTFMVSIACLIFVFDSRFTKTRFNFWWFLLEGFLGLGCAIGVMLATH